jgi:hypothetical protein
MRVCYLDQRSSRPRRLDDLQQLKGHLPLARIAEADSSDRLNSSGVTKGRVEAQTLARSLSSSPPSNRRTHPNAMRCSLFGERTTTMLNQYFCHRSSRAFREAVVRSAFGPLGMPPAFAGRSPSASARKADGPSPKGWAVHQRDDLDSTSVRFESWLCENPFPGCSDARLIQAQYERVAAGNPTDIILVRFSNVSRSCCSICVSARFDLNQKEYGAPRSIIFTFDPEMPTYEAQNARNRNPRLCSPAI